MDPVFFDQLLLFFDESLHSPSMEQSWKTTDLARCHSHVAPLGQWVRGPLFLQNDRLGLCNPMLRQKPDVVHTGSETGAINGYGVRRAGVRVSIIEQSVPAAQGIPELNSNYLGLVHFEGDGGARVEWIGIGRCKPDGLRKTVGFFRIGRQPLLECADIAAEVAPDWITEATIVRP